MADNSTLKCSGSTACRVSVALLTGCVAGLVLSAVARSPARIPGPGGEVEHDAEADGDIIWVAAAAIDDEGAEQVAKGLDQQDYVFPAIDFKTHQPVIDRDMSGEPTILGEIQLLSTSFHADLLEARRSALAGGMVRALPYNVCPMSLRSQSEDYAFLTCAFDQSLRYVFRIDRATSPVAFDVLRAIARLQSHPDYRRQFASRLLRR